MRAQNDSKEKRSLLIFLQLPAFAWRSNHSFQDDEAEGYAMMMMCTNMCVISQNVLQIEEGLMALFTFRIRSTIHYFYEKYCI